MRLSAYNAALSAGFVGLKYDLDIGRLSIHPFGEIGAGRLVTRFDSGGYYAVQSGTSVYSPVWRREQLDGLVFGGGATVGWLVAPHIRVSALLGHWSFSLTPHAPKIPVLYYGGGIRWER